VRTFIKYSSCVALLLFSANSLAQKAEKKIQPTKAMQLAPAPAATLQPVLTNFSVTASDESLMSESPLTLDPGDLIEIKRYDSNTKTYQVIVVDDPTPEEIYATPESVSQAIHSLNPDSMKADPKDIVGSRYNTDEGLVILFDFERDQRKTKSGF
jgi:hypothetical protein